MEHTTVMVKEYATQHDVTTDEQKLRREGWAVQSTVYPYQTQGMAKRLLARFTHTEAHLVVTYTRTRARSV
jgi:hypothetical protein